MLASCARGAEGVAVDPEERRVSLAVAVVVVVAGPFDTRLVRALSDDGPEDGVDGLGEAGVPVTLGTIGLGTAHKASRFLRLAAYLLIVSANCPCGGL